MSWSSDDSVVSVIAAADPASRIASGGRSREIVRDTKRKSTTPNKQLPDQPANSPVPKPTTLDRQELKKFSVSASTDNHLPYTTNTASISQQISEPENKQNQTPPQQNKCSITETQKASNPTIPARVLRRRNRSSSAGKREKIGLIAKDSSTQKADISSSEKLKKVEEQNISLVLSESSAKSTESLRDKNNENQLKDTFAVKETMGNRLSSERNKNSKDQDAKKKTKEAKKNSKARKSKSPTSDRESAVENRSSIETTDSYSSAATLVATANAAVGRRSPKKSPRSIPRSGVKLREAFSSDDESLTSAGFRTPQATTPLMKRATEQTSPSQKLLEFGKNIEREIGKFTRKSPTTHEKQNNGTDKFLTVHHKRSSRDGAIETDSDSFAMFENTEQLYATAPKDIFPIDDNLSDDVFMSCIDLAANSPDIPSRSQNKNIASQASPLSVKKLPGSSEVKDAEPKQKMTLLQIAKQGSLQPPPKLGDVKEESSRRTQTLPTKSPEKSPSSARRFHSESPKAAPSLTVADGGKMIQSEEKIKLRHSPVVPRRFIVDDSKTRKASKSPTPPTKVKPKSINTATDQKSPKTHRHNRKGSKSPSPQKRVQTKSSSPPPTVPRRFPAENYSPKIKKRIQAAPGSPVIPPHKSKEGSKSPTVPRQINSSAPISPSQKRKVDAPFPLKPSVIVVAQTKDSVETTSSKCSKAEEESSQIQDSPKTPKQDKMLLGVTKKKEHLRSTYDNVPDSDDSMAYFTDKNDPNFFEDNCVSEDIVATEKTPLHYKVEEPKKLGIEIMQAPTKATIECVQQECDPQIHAVDTKPETTFQSTLVTTAPSAGESKTVGGIVKELVTASKIKSTSATTLTEKTVTSMVAVESHLQNKSEQSSKLQTRPSEQPVPNSPVKLCVSADPVAVDSVVHRQPVEKTEPNAHRAEETEHLTQRQIRRRNKKKQLQMSDKGSLDSSDAPLSPTLTGSDNPRPLENKNDCRAEAAEKTVSPQKLQSAMSLQEDLVQCNDPSEQQKNINSKSPSVKQGSIKRDHVPPPSPSANEALGGIVEEDEDREDMDEIFVDEKAREVLVFGESVLKRLSSLVESQGDSNELENRFHRDFDVTDDMDSELNDKKSCLEVLDEICDMGEKFKKEHEIEPESPTVRTISDIKKECSMKCESDGKLSVQGSPSVQKRPSIPNELQLSSVENNMSVFSTDHSVNEPKRDSQKLTEVIDSYGEELSPCVDNFSRPNGSHIIPNKTNIVIQDDAKSRSSDEEFLSAERRFSNEALQVPAIEETFSELMSVKNILQEMEDKTPTSEPLLRFIGPSDLASPPSYLTGSGRRSRMSPAITERTESELDISEQLDNVSISTDSMYADDEDDGSEMIINKTYTEETGGECQVSYTFYNTAQGYDSDEFWANSSAAEENFQVLEEPTNQASCTFKKARTEMHEIQRHLQDLRRQMEYLQDDVQGTPLTPSGSSEWRPLSE